jgi:hypothetical protein
MFRLTLVIIRYLKIVGEKCCAHRWDYITNIRTMKQFSPPIFKHLMMTNVGRNMYCNVYKLLNKF